MACSFPAVVGPVFPTVSDTEFPCIDVPGIDHINSLGATGEDEIVNCNLHSLLMLQRNRSAGASGGLRFLLLCFLPLANLATAFHFTHGVVSGRKLNCCQFLHEVTIGDIQRCYKESPCWLREVHGLDGCGHGFYDQGVDRPARGECRLRRSRRWWRRPGWLSEGALSVRRPTASWSMCRRLPFRS